MQAPSYGSLPDDLPGARSAEARQGSNKWRRVVAIAVMTLGCLAVVGILAVQQSPPAALCDDIECMINSPTKPPGAIKVPPRTLNTDEVAKLQEALAEEQALESKVSSPPEPPALIARDLWSAKTLRSMSLAAMCLRAVFPLVGVFFSLLEASSPTAF